jgi:retron-type reverse transcriptase
MSLAKMDTIINLLRQERYRWKPVRRVLMPKRTSAKKRALGLPTWSDKLLQEVIRLILEAYFEPSLSKHSPGFRPQRGCHTALKDIYEHWAGVTCYREGDSSACFDSLSHPLLLEMLAEHIHDGRFLRLMHGLLQAGYLEPALTKGERRRANPTYSRIESAMQRKRKQGKIEDVKRLEQHRRTLPSSDPEAPTYRRLRDCRYADDWLLGFIGSKEEAEEITCQGGELLNEHLSLELCKTKTLITHGANGEGAVPRL